MILPLEVLLDGVVCATTKRVKNVAFLESLSGSQRSQQLVTVNSEQVSSEK